jgi:hypothetical protein
MRGPKKVKDEKEKKKTKEKYKNKTKVLKEAERLVGEIIN